jgi:hypothetical protein
MDYMSKEESSMAIPKTMRAAVVEKFREPLVLRELPVPTPWFWLINLLFVPHHGLAIWIPIGAGVVWSLLSFALVRYWSAACGLRDIQRLAIFFGALLGSMGLDARLAGWTDLDLIATFVFQLLAVMGFVLPARKIWQRCRHRPSRAPRVSLMRSALLS